VKVKKYFVINELLVLYIKIFVIYFSDEIRQDIEDAVSHMKPW